MGYFGKRSHQDSPPYPDGHTVNETVPDSTWDSATASDAFIEKIGLPPRPTSNDAQALQTPVDMTHDEWVQTFAHINAPPARRLCIGAVAAVSNNWAGPIATDAAPVNVTNYARTDSIETEPNIGTSCAGATSTAWNGLGGFYASLPGGPGVQRLMQAGVNYPGGGLMAGAWWEALVEQNGVDIHDTGQTFFMSPFVPAVASHQYESYVNYNASANTVTFTVVDRTANIVGYEPPQNVLHDSITNNLYAPSAWYDGRSSEDVIERISYRNNQGVFTMRPLANFANLESQKFYVARTGGTGASWATYAHDAIQMVLDINNPTVNQLTDQPYHAGTQGWGVDYNQCQ